MSDGNKITDDLKHSQPYLTEIKEDGFQEKNYLQIMDLLKNKGTEDDNEENTTYGYNTLLKPIQAPNFVFHTKIVGRKMSGLHATIIEHKTADAISYDYTESTFKSFGRIFSKKNLNKYLNSVDSTVIISVYVGIFVLYELYCVLCDFLPDENGSTDITRMQKCMMLIH